MLSLAPVLLPRARSCSLGAPSVLRLKRPCSPSRSKRATHERKFGAYITYIYIAPTQRITLQPPFQPLKAGTVAPNLCLFFNRTEYDDLITRTQNRTTSNNRPLLLSLEMKEYIWNLTNGHPGAVKSLLLVLREAENMRIYRKEGKEVSSPRGLVSIVQGFEILSYCKKFPEI